MSSNSSSNNPVYRDLKLLQAGGAHEVPQDYNPQSRTACQQRGYSPGMDQQRNYEKEHQPSPSSREEERKSAWDYSERSARKEYSRSRDYSNEYRKCFTILPREIASTSRDIFATLISALSLLLRFGECFEFFQIYLRILLRILLRNAICDSCDLMPS